MIGVYPLMCLDGPRASLLQDLGTLGIHGHVDCSVDCQTTEFWFSDASFQRLHDLAILREIAS